MTHNAPELVPSHSTCCCCALQAVGGLPVVVTDRSVTIESARRLLAAVCVWAVLASANFTATFFAACAGVVDIADFVNGMADFGMSVVDVICVMSSFVLDFVALVAVLVLIASRRKQINGLILAIAAAQSLPLEVVANVRRKETRFAICMIVIGLIGAGVQFIPFYCSFGHRKGISSAVQILFALIYCVALFHVILPPLAVGVYLVFKLMLGHLIDCIRFWSEQEQSSKSVGKLFSCDEAVVASGERLLDLLRELNSVTGSILFLETSKMLFNAILLTLFVSSGYKISWMSDGLARDARIGFVVSCAIYLVMSLMYLWNWTQAGQDLLDQLECAKRSCQRLRVSHDDWLSAKLKLRLEQLAANLGSCSGVTPMSAFVLGTTSTLSALGLLVTYFVVLFQFNIAPPQ